MYDLFQARVPFCLAIPQKCVRKWFLMTIQDLFQISVFFGQIYVHCQTFSQDSLELYHKRYQMRW